MKASSLLTWLGIAVASISHLLVGAAISSTGRIIVRLYADLQEVELPWISARLIPYAESGLSLGTGALLAVLTAALLGLLNIKEKLRPFLPIALALSMVIAVLHLAACWFATSLPLLKITTEINP